VGEENRASEIDFAQWRARRVDTWRMNDESKRLPAESDSSAPVAASSPSGPYAPGSSLTADAALALLRGELLAMPAPSSGPTNLDPAGAPMMVLSLVEPITGYRTAVLELIGERAVRAFDRLELVALAALGAHLDVLVDEPPTDLGPIAFELKRLRRSMRAELQLLAGRGLVDERAAREVTGRRGHRDLVLDVLLLATLFETHWAVTEAHTSLTRSQLAGAEALANELMEALGPKGRSAAEDLRARALDLLVQTYGEVQRALDYLRWHQDDAHLIAPSLWKRPGSGRRARRSSDSSAQRERAQVDDVPDDSGEPSAEQLASESEGAR
jgi:hypothetical protein